MRLPRFLMPPGRFDPGDRTIVLLTSLAGFFQGYALAQASNTLPFVRRSLGVDAATMSGILAIVRLGAVAALVLALRADRHGRRSLLLLSLATMLVTSAATALAPDAFTFGALQTAVRFSGSATGAIALVLLAETLTPSIRAYGLSMFGASVSFGAGVALFSVSLADVSMDAWRWIYAATALGLGILPPLFRRLPESPLYASGRPPADLFAPLRARTDRFWVVAFMSFLAASFSAPAATFLMERLVNGVGLSAPWAVGILLSGGTIGGLGFLVGGRSADLWGRKPTLVWALVASAIGGLAIYRLSSLPALVIAATVSGFGGFAAVPALGALRNELFPTRMRTVAVTWLNVAGVLGAAAGLAAARLLIASVGLSDTMTILSLAMAAAAALVVWVPETRGRPLPD